MNGPVDVVAMMDALLAFASRGVETDDPARPMIERGHEARAAVAELVDDADSMAKWISNSGPGLPDHACVECVADGELVKAGFRCGYHRALARVGAK